MRVILIFNMYRARGRGRGGGHFSRIEEKKHHNYHFGKIILKRELDLEECNNLTKDKKELWRRRVSIPVPLAC